MISVVIPLYNKESLIKETIDSVLSQTFSNFEILIINDGSTDNSLQTVEAINDNRITIINQENAGVSVARNSGVKKAKYPWVAFLDADDWWSSTFLEEVTNAIHTYPNEQLFATGRSRVFTTETERYVNQFLPGNGELGIVNYFEVISKYLPPINSSNVVIKKNLFEKRGYFNNGQKKHEDHDMWLRLCINKSVVFINKPLSFYRKTETNTASSSYYEALDFSIYIDTLLAVNKTLNHEDRVFFRNYYNRFCLQTYIKNYRFYSKDEDRIVYAKLIQLVTGHNKTILKILKVFPYKNIYPLLKTLKR